MIVIEGMRTLGGMNSREHWARRAKRVRLERNMVAMMLHGKEKPATPLVVTLTRVAPSNGMDDDGLVSALKSVRDQFAVWIGVNDKHRNIVRYEYNQRRGPWSVEIEWTCMQSRL